MESNDQIIKDINNILNVNENDYIIKDNFSKIKDQINCKVPNNEENKNIVNLIIKITEKIIKVFMNYRIKDINSNIEKKVKKVKEIMKKFKDIIESIKIQKTFPNNIESDEKIKKDIIPSYRKYGKEFDNHKKEIVFKANYYLNSFKKLSELMKNLKKSLLFTIEKFEELSEKIQKDENNNKKVEEYIFQIYDTYKKIIESFKEYGNFFFEVKDAGKNLGNIFNNLHQRCIDIKQKINNYQGDLQVEEIKKFFPLLDLKMNDELNKISKDLKKDLEEFQNLKIRDARDVSGVRELSDENAVRLDLLIILDITNSMGKYLDFFKKKLKEIIEQIKNKCPLYLIYLGFIGYKDFSDLELGDEYINIDFTLNYDSVCNKIKDIDVDGGDDIPEDVAGAFKMAKEKIWGKGKKLIILITDSPCHGIDYHDLDQTKEEYKDNYPKGFYEGEENLEEYKREKIDDYVEFFAKNDISMICFQILNITERMYDTFKKIYEKEKKPELFSIEKNNLDKIIINKALKIYETEEKKLLDKLEKKYLVAN